MGALITQLKREGVLRLFHDYRSGTLRDLSGNGNHGTGSNIRFIKGVGVVFRNPDGYIVVANSASITLTEGAFVIFSDLDKLEIQAPVSWVFSKRDAGGINYDFRLNSGPQWQFYDGTASRILADDYRGAKSVGVNFGNGVVAQGYKTGIYAGLFSAASTITADDAPLYIGNWHSATSSMLNPMKAVILCSRQLTAKEHATLVKEVIG